MIDLIAWILIAATLAAVLLHGIARYFAARRRNA
jgi:hypothetical protein